MSFEFGDPQNIVEFEMAFYKGDERTRAFTVTTVSWTDGTQETHEFISGGESLGFEVFPLDSDDTHMVIVTPAEPNFYDWFSITEVGNEVYYCCLRMTLVRSCNKSRFFEIIW